MYPTSVTALFCDDIREEKSGALTLVGVIGDNVNIPEQPENPNAVAVIPKLAIYLRINFDVSAELGDVAFKITLPDGTEVDGGVVDQRTIAQARETREKGNPLGGIVSRFQIGGFTVRKPGRMTVTATIGGQTYLAGFLNFITPRAETNS